MIVHHLGCVNYTLLRLSHSFCLHLTADLPVYILCDVTDNESQTEPELSPGQRVAKQVKERHERRQFYVDSLTGPERSKLAARFLRRHSRENQKLLLRELSIAEIAYGEVFAVETYGW